MSLQEREYHEPTRNAPSASAVTPHPAPDERRLSQATERTLRDLVQLHRFNQVPAHRLELAGVPPLRAVLREVQRRADTPPIVEARCTWDRQSRYWKLTIDCPHCGRQHWHGGGTEAEPDLGHRNSHCVDSRNISYILVAGAETALAS